MSYADGVADAMVEIEATRSLYRANRAEVDARAAEEKAKKHAMEAQSLLSEKQKLSGYVKELRKRFDEEQAVASGSLIVINAMVKAMENLDPVTREKFRDRVAQLARNRMIELDTTDPLPMSIAQTFGALRENKELGII